MKDCDLYIDLILNEKIKTNNINKSYQERTLQLEIPRPEIISKEIKKDVEPKRVIIIDI